MLGLGCCQKSFWPCGLHYHELGRRWPLVRHRRPYDPCQLRSATMVGSPAPVLRSMDARRRMARPGQLSAIAVVQTASEHPDSKRDYASWKRPALRSSPFHGEAAAKTLAARSPTSAKPIRECR